LSAFNRRLIVVVVIVLVDVVEKGKHAIATARHYGGEE
jgi:hypothetical protein